MNYLAYIFDFDYTLADASEGIVACFKYVFNLYNLHIPSDETIKKTIGLTLEEAFSDMSGIVDKDLLSKMRKDYVLKADEVMVPSTKLLPYTKKVISSLKNSGSILGIVSTKYRYRIVNSLNQFNITSFFDVIVGGEDVKYSKPNPEGLLKIIESINLNKKDVLYIGDSYIDAETAKRAEVDFAGVTTGTTTKDDFLRYNCKYILSSLQDLIV